VASVRRTPGPGAERLRLLLAGVENKVGKVGFFETSKYPDGTPVAYVATIHEFGAPSEGIPPRPFMRPTIQANQAVWQSIALQGAKSILDGSMTSEDILEVIGLKAAGDIRKMIASIQAPPLKDATVAARLRGKADKQTVGNLTKPLVDTATMLNAVTNTVEDKA